MIKNLALLLMAASLLFVEAFLEDGGELDRLNEMGSGVRDHSVSGGSMTTQTSEISSRGEKPEWLRAHQARRLTNPWNSPSEAEVRPDGHHATPARHPADLRTQIRASPSSGDGALSPDQMNLEM